MTMCCRRLGVWSCFFLSVRLAYAQTPVCVNETLVDNSQELPYLKARFPALSWTKSPRNPYLGGQNQTYCCARAVDEYISNGCMNNSLVRVNERILEPNVEFPCGALWNGDLLGAPEVQITYGHARDICPGWTVSAPNSVNQWAQLLVGFILPAVVYSFNISRPRKLRVWEKTFLTDRGNYLYRTVGSLVGLVVTAICVTVDTVIWLMAIFAFAGPLLLSGVYEAQLDKRVVEFLERNRQLPVALRARMMFTVLCGNLSMYPAWSDSMDLAKHLDELDRVSPLLVQSHQVFAQAVPYMQLSSSTGNAEGVASNQVTVQPAKLQSLVQTPEVPPKPRQATNTSPLTGINNLDEGIIPSALTESYTRSRTIRKVIVRLKAMLECQYSFGTTLGGPMLFFLGSFVYALLEVKDATGDEDIAQALAFGMWWMVIPHVAVVASLLLAGNNPNILESIVSIRDLRYSVGENLLGPRERRSTMAFHVNTLNTYGAKVQRRPSRFVERVYKGEYEPAWMWNRGRCKQDWLVVLFVDSWLKYQQYDKPILDVQESLAEFLSNVVMLSGLDWLFLWTSAFLLVFIPCLFGFLTAYYTPVVGISCRALTMLVYLSAQTLLLLLWAYHLTLRDNHWVLGHEVKKHLKQGLGSSRLKDAIARLRHQAAYDTTMPVARYRDHRGILAREDCNKATLTSHWSLQLLFYGLCLLGAMTSLLTSTGGSLLQTIGVFRNSLCHLTIVNWRPSRRTETFITISRETYTDIVQAKQHWLVIGTCSAMFLAVTCYIGWWYQKRLRTMFMDLADLLDDHREPEADTDNKFHFNA